MHATDGHAVTSAQPRTGRRNALVVSLAILVAYALAHAALLDRFPWFVDETYFASIAQAAQADPAQRFGALVDHKGLLSSWIAALLIHFDVPPMTAMRVISIASGAVALVATGFLAWRWNASVRLALVASALVAFIPYMFVNDSVGVYDAFIAGFSMLALVLELELARRQRLDLALLLGATLGALLLTKPTGQLAILLIPVSLLVFDWRREARWRRLGIWAALATLAVAIAISMYAVTRLSPLAYTPDLQNHRTVSDFFHDPFGKLGVVWRPALAALWGYLTPPGIALTLWGLVRVVVTRNRLGIVAGVWAAAALVAFLLLTDSGYPRYGLQAIPPLCLLIAIGALDLWDRVTARVSWYWVAVLALVFAIPAALLDGRVLLNPRTAPYPGLDYDQYVKLISNREPAREAAEIIVARAGRTFPASTPPVDRWVADVGGFSWAVPLVLNGTHLPRTPRFSYMDQTSVPRQVNAARFLIVEGDAPPWLKIGNARVIRRWSRGGGGPPVVLYERPA